MAEKAWAFRGKYGQVCLAGGGRDARASSPSRSANAPLHGGVPSKPSRKIDSSLPSSMSR